MYLKRRNQNENQDSFSYCAVRIFTGSSLDSIKNDKLLSFFSVLYYLNMNCFSFIEYSSFHILFYPRICRIISDINAVPEITNKNILDAILGK